ncbi:TPA: hypothetical protein ACH3X1_000633 [Trebouxia sp. C0004]
MPKGEQLASCKKTAKHERLAMLFPEQVAHEEQGCQQTSRHTCCTWSGLLPGSRHGRSQADQLNDGRPSSALKACRLDAAVALTVKGCQTVCSNSNVDAA